MLIRFDLWGRFLSAMQWSSSVLFTVMLYLAEPLFLHRWLDARAKAKPKATFRLVEWMHWLLLTDFAAQELKRCSLQRQGWRETMYRQFGNSAYRRGPAGQADHHLSIAKSGQLDALVALERIGTRLSFGRNDEIYGEGDEAECWYKVISGTVRICKLLADGRRHIAEFCFSGDCFGIDNAHERIYAAEAVDDVIVMRFRRGPTEKLIDQNPMVARLLRDAMVRDLTSAHGRTLLLGRMTAPERIAAFLLEMFERRERTKTLDLPMPRIDIADYLGLTVETVCRTLSTFRRNELIAVPNPHRIELLDRAALEEIGEA